VIDIDDNLYTRLFDNGDEYVADMRRACVAIRKGTPLPKGHGRLIDADTFIAMLENTSKRQNYKELLIGEFLTVDDVFEAIIGSLQNKGLAENDTPTIIEADKEGEE
jgi:hypothetical protein